MPGYIFLCHVLQPNSGLHNCYFPVKVGLRVLIFSLTLFQALVMTYYYQNPPQLHITYQFHFTALNQF